MNFEHDFSGDDDLKQAYSYDRPSWMVMNALMNGFMANGLTEEQARVLFSSKAIRHALDQSFGEALEAMAYHFGITISNQYKHEPWLNEELV